MPPTSSEQTMSLKTPSSREDSCDSEQESQTFCDTDVPSPDAAPDAKAGNPSEEPVGDGPSDADEPGEDPLPGEEVPAEDAPGEGPSAETPAEAPTGGTREGDEQPSDGEREGLGTITTDVIAPFPSTRARTRVANRRDGTATTGSSTSSAASRSSAWSPRSRRWAAAARASTTLRPTS